LGLDAVPTPHDAADALAVAICHLHAGKGTSKGRPASKGTKAETSWRHFKPAVVR
jgi:hypothetical protein